MVSILDCQIQKWNCYDTSEKFQFVANRCSEAVGLATWVMPVAKGAQAVWAGSRWGASLLTRKTAEKTSTSLLSKGTLNRGE